MARQSSRTGGERCVLCGAPGASYGLSQDPERQLCQSCYSKSYKPDASMADVVNGHVNAGGTIYEGDEPLTRPPGSAGTAFAALCKERGCTHDQMITMNERIAGAIDDSILCRQRARLRNQYRPRHAPDCNVKLEFMDCSIFLKTD